VNNTTNVVAGVAVTTPWWLPYLQGGSEIAALLLPIAGLFWLIIQIMGYVFKTRKEAHG
jgi:hypothetical protein